MDIRKFSEDEFKTWLNELIELNDYLDGCVTCGLPRLLHKGQSCTQRSQVYSQEIVNIWKDYREKIKPIVVWMRREKDEEKETKAWIKSLEALTEKRNASNASRYPDLERLVEMLEKKWPEEDKAELGNMARVVKPAKVPIWTNDMTLETFFYYMLHPV